MKVLIIKEIQQEALVELEKFGFEIVVNKDKEALSTSDMIDICQGMDYVVHVSHTPLNAAFFEKCPSLKAVALTSVGYDHVDLEAASRHGVQISNTPSVLSGATADIAFLLMLSVSRKAFGRAREIVEGKWKEFGFTQELGIELNNKTLGIVGLGRIGVELARKAKGAYDMDILYHNRNRNEKYEDELGAVYMSFDELLSKSDVVSVHTNLTEETKFKFDKNAFEKMKKSAIFINTARGKIHKEADLITALQQGKIWGAGLDVTDPEPMQPDNPLLSMSNVCVLPHIGSATVETRTVMSLMAAKNIIAAAKGERVPQLINQDVVI